MCDDTKSNFETIVRLRVEKMELEAIIDDLLIKLTGGEELYISRGIEIVTLKAQVKKYKKFHGMYGFEKMEVARHVQLYKDYQKKFRGYYEKTEAKIAQKQGEIDSMCIYVTKLEKKVARYERDVTDDDVFLGGMIP